MTKMLKLCLVISVISIPVGSKADQSYVCNRIVDQTQLYTTPDHFQLTLDGSKASLIQTWASGDTPTTIHGNRSANGYYLVTDAADRGALTQGTEYEITEIIVAAGSQPGHIRTGLTFVGSRTYHNYFDCK